MRTANLRHARNRAAADWRRMQQIRCMSEWVRLAENQNMAISRADFPNRDADCQRGAGVR
jgi:hypothetical protein